MALRRMVAVWNPTLYKIPAVRAWFCMNRLPSGLKDA